MKVLIDLDIKPPKGYGKGAVQIDYILAVSIFLIFFALSIQYTTDYFSTIRDTATISSVRSEVISLLDIADFAPEPATWPQISNITNDLILLLHFNNGTLDYSGKGNNGTINDGANCSASVVGRFFGGCSFDGIDDGVNLSGGSFTDYRTEGTFMAWVRTVSNTTAAQQIMHSGAAYMEFSISSGTDVNINTGTDWYTYNVVTPDNWYHIAATWSQSGNYRRLYVDGALKNSTTHANGGSLTSNVYIGRRGSGEVFNGTIDEVAMWNRSLTAAEISELYQQSLNRIGLRTEAFRFIVIVNNTKPYLVNTSENATARTLADEIVRFNMSDFGFNGADYNSVVIYNSTGDTLPFMINGSNITFRANVTVNTSMEFTVYFDDDSGFGEKSLDITGVDNLTETFHPVERISVLQYEKLRQLNMSNYTHVLAKTGTENDFRIKLADADTNATFMEFGGTVPRRGHVVALQRYAVFQNSTAGMRNGRITIQSW